MRHFINDTEIAPRELVTIGLNNDFTDRQGILESTADRIVLPREGRDLVLQHIATQGVFEGIPYKMITQSGIELEYYIDLTENAVFRDHELEVTIKRRGGKDNFFDNANGTSFDLMAAQGVNFQYIDVPYVIVKDNAVELGITLALSIYVLTKELIAQIVALSESITNIIDALPPLPANAGQLSTLIIKALLQLAVVALTLIALVKMAQQFFELLFPKLRYFQACKVKELLQKGCQYLGYNFQSDLLDQLPGLTILPVPLVKEKCSFFDSLQNDLNFAYTNGHPGAPDTVSTLGRLFEVMESMFNARTRVNNGVVRLERRDYWQNLTTNLLQPAVNLQNERDQEYTLNTVEAWKRYYIHYQVDQSDLHTLDFFDPTTAEYSTEALSPINPDLVSIKGLNDVSIPFALGVRKNNLNWIEKIVKGFFELIDEVVNAFGGNGNLAAQIQNRIGVLQVSQQFFSTTKLMYTVNGKQPANYAETIQAAAIYKNYHKINEIALNDYRIIEGAPVRLNAQEFVNLLDNNFAEINGQVCEILTVQYFDEQYKAIISYKCPFDYADNTVEVIEVTGESNSALTNNNC